MLVLSPGIKINVSLKRVFSVKISMAHDNLSKIYVNVLVFDCQYPKDGKSMELA